MTGSFIYFVMGVWSRYSQLFVFYKFVNSTYFDFKRTKGSKM